MNIIYNVVLSDFSTLTRNAIMAYFAATIASSQTILYKNILADTINKYLSEAMAFSWPFHATNQLIKIINEKFTTRQGYYPRGNTLGIYDQLMKTYD